MDQSRDTGIVVLLLLVATCLTVFLLEVGQPTGRVVDFLFPAL